MRLLPRSFAALALAVTVAAPALAEQRDHRPANAHGGVHAPQHAPGHAQAGKVPGDVISGPFGFSAHGAYRMMMQRQDFTPKVQLTGR